MAKLLFIFGTRPEAIKLAPVIQLAKANPAFEVKVLVTAQHRQMLDQVLEIFEIKPDFDLNLMRNDQDFTDITIRILDGCRNIFETYIPDLVIVHGDTSTTFASSLASFYKKIDVAHVEAGLRTFDSYSPYPEEMNRVLTSRLAKYHFAPTTSSFENLIRENIPKENILVTGNTVVDSLLSVTIRIDSNLKLKDQILSNLKKEVRGFGEKKIVLITIHRRENIGRGVENICEAIAELSNKLPNVDFIFPVHLNPNVQKTVKSLLEGIKNVHLIKPLEYLPFVYLMRECNLIITDSGGIQEEAPTFQKPILVTRESTERPEAIASGHVTLVGTSTRLIVDKALLFLIDDTKNDNSSNILNPYGDGHASEKILNFIEAKLFNLETSIKTTE